MAETVFLTIDVIKQAASVANSFAQYTKSVKDAPKVVKSITLEVNILKGILEYLGATIEGDIDPTNKASLEECLNSCRGTLSELEKLVAPEDKDDSDSSDSSSHGKTASVFRSLKATREKRTPSPFNNPNLSDAMGVSKLVSPFEELRFPVSNLTFRTNMDSSQPLPVRTATPQPRQSSMSLRRRLKWPLVRQGKAEKLLKELERQKSQLNIAIQADNLSNLAVISNAVKDVEAVLNDNEKRRILSWLKPKIDMREFHAEQHDKQEDETCTWITERDQWREWLEGVKAGPDSYERFIWIFGIPGAGKTVLASFLIDAIGTSCKATGYSFYYCHHERNQDETLHFLRWIISDLSRQIGRFIPKELEELSKGENFSIPGLMSCFLAISQRFAQNGSRVFLVVDAVDESRKPRERFLKQLIEIGTNPMYNNVSLLMTSREETDIKAMMTGGEEDEVPSSKKVLHTHITMSNAEVMHAIRKYVKKQFGKNNKFKIWPPDFRTKVEETLARNARGMFRWVACQVDIIERLYLDQSRVMAALNNLPETLFDTYARILEGIQPEERAFARTALALICSNTSNIKSADVLVQASLHNVRHGAMHMYDVRALEGILGCLIKVTPLRVKPQHIFKREDDGLCLQKVNIAHYTVREFLFAPSKDGDDKPRPAGEFALTDLDIRMLEMQVVFNGLQQWGRNRPANQRNPSRYEEHCLEMSDWALRGDRRNLIVRFQSVFDSVVPCLRPDAEHVKSLRSERLRKRFTKWRKLCAFGEYEDGTRRRVRHETSTLASLVLLRWPEFAQKLLRGAGWERLTPERKQMVWTDEFTIDAGIDDSLPPTFEKGEPVSLLRLCVSWKRLEFLEIFIEAGANFVNEPNIVFVALEHPYSEDGDDGQMTGQLLKMILESGADPNPPGFLYTPLQDAVHRLEEGWVQSLLLECRDANAIGDPNGTHPYNIIEEMAWHKQHPLEICRTAKPHWKGGDGLEEQIEKSRKQVHLLLSQYGAGRPVPGAAEPEVIELDDS
ncbi:uncharacterized protein GGS22DRAFT_191602 [Annulohypoxylon maeteangense]|uniref:uncharacterized protein n=1 Tax=Annulohypoxylon maeteangense TaxID=1927788 RepID=UPI0020085268|nr:uncharacterized protein GGS22DRAFT_191602 [Annulohypoxylon maeteangense]KAI0881879.1 hypothetical protein GGS22DRAFT_191602 [Annulohypoxylon maeteangense]